MTHGLEVRQYMIPKPNGDRATSSTPCYDFKVYLNDRFIQKFSQYDSWHCHVASYKASLREVFDMTDNLADALAIRRPDKPITYIERRVARTEWIPA